MYVPGLASLCWKGGWQPMTQRDLREQGIIPLPSGLR